MLIPIGKDQAEVRRYPWIFIFEDVQCNVNRLRQRTGRAAETTVEPARRTAPGEWG